MMLEAVGLKKHFPIDERVSPWAGPRGWVKAVDGVSVQVAEGETLGIVGESGSGKTTLAKLFLLLERPTAGALRFDGKDDRATSVATISRAIGGRAGGVPGPVQLAESADARGAHRRRAAAPRRTA